MAREKSSHFGVLAYNGCLSASRRAWALCVAIWYSAFWRTWTATIMMATLGECFSLHLLLPVLTMALLLITGLFVCFTALYFFVQSGSTRQIDSLFELSQGLSNGINVAELELGGSLLGAWSGSAVELTPPRSGRLGRIRIRR